MNRMKVLIDMPADCTAESLQWQYLQQIIHSVLQNNAQFLTLLLPEETASAWIYLEGNSDINVVVVKKSSWLRKWIYEKWTLPRLVKKNSIECYIGINRQPTLPNDTRQLLVLDQLRFLSNTAYRKDIGDRMIVPNRYWQDQLKNLHPNLDITEWMPVAKEITSSPQACSTFRSMHSSDRDYFFMHSNDMDTTTLTSLLKAYSIFKKFQQSGLQMVVSLPSKIINDFQPLFKNYKYKNDVHFIADMAVNDMKTAIAGAYATLFSDREPVITAPMLWSLQAGIPMILPANACLQSAWSDQALFAENSEKGWATPLMLLYKDESLRSRLSESSRLLAMQYGTPPMDISRLLTSSR